MDPRAQRESIRQHLIAARTALDAGDIRAARVAVTAALALDPDYLAARDLGDRIEAAARAGRTQGSAAADPALPAEPPVVSADGWARFEHRARQRRIEKRSMAAREAIAAGRLEEARAIIEDIREIDGAHPELISLGIELDAAEHEPEAERGAIGPLAAVAAAALAVAIGVGAAQLPSGRPTVPYVAPPILHAALPAPALPVARPDLAVDGAVAPSRGDAERAPSASAETADVAREERSLWPQPQSEAPAVSTWEPIRWPPPEPTVAAAASRTEDVDPRPSGGAEAETTLSNARAAVGGVASALSPFVTSEERNDAAPAVVPVSGRVGDSSSRGAALMRPTSGDVGGDEDQVLRVLQQYRRAYETLDAQSARAVWPAVNGAALQRAFDALESQRLTFDTCRVNLHGTAGTATCTGSTRYVPKVGSHEPRVEPRVWTFGVRRSGESWQIASARADR